MPERPEFWKHVLEALGTEPRDATRVSGASGIRHEIVTLGVDDQNRRVVIIGVDDSPRLASLTRADIQAAMGDMQVLMARPTMFSSRDFASTVVESVGTSIMDLTMFAPLEGETQSDVQSRVNSLLSPAVNLVGGWVSNAASVRGIRQGFRQLIDDLSRLKFSNEDSTFSIDFGGLLVDSDQQLDSELGICTLPLYNFTADQMDVIQDGQDVRDYRDVLRGHGVLQYFYPAPDQLVLGAIDRGIDLSKNEPIGIARNAGHPMGPNEIVDGSVSGLDYLIDALAERKLVTKGEYEVKLSDAGRTERLSVQFEPREGLISKIVNRISVSLDIKSLLGVNIGTSTKSEDN